MEKCFDKLSVVVSTSENYKFLLEGFAKLYLKYTDKLPRMLFTTINDDFSYNGIFIKGNNYKGKDDSFSTRLIKTLQLIESEFILFFLEDFFLVSQVNEIFIQEGIKILLNDPNITSITLQDFTSHKQLCSDHYNDKFMLRSRNSPYQCNAEVSLWRKDDLLSILRKGENAWDFEMIGTYRMSKYHMKSLYRNDMFNNEIPYLLGGIMRRGKMNPAYSPFLSKEKIQIKNLNINHAKQHKISFFDKIYLYIYPWLSVYFRSIKKRLPGIPAYVCKINQIY